MTRAGGELGEQGEIGLFVTLYNIIEFMNISMEYFATEGHAVWKQAHN
jgi:hypothetical protein